MKIEGNYLLIDANGWDYDIPLNELTTEKGLEGWLCHMDEKTWFKSGMAKYMVALCEHQFGYKFNGKFSY